jgi:OmpA-OmpF porin, OOP family
MKHLVLSATAICSFFIAFAQTSNPQPKVQKLGIQITQHDFVTAAEMRSRGFSSPVASGDWAKLNKMKTGVAVTYTSSLGENFDFNGRLGMTFVEASAFSNRPKSNQSKIYVESDANIFMKLLPDSYTVSPFLSLGAGVAMSDIYYAAYVPTGAGLQLNLFDESFVVLQAQYRIPATTNTAHHLFYSIGFSSKLGK